MILVDESARRYAAATTSGVIFGFAWYNIGMKIGPSNIHFEDKPPTNKLMIAVMMMKPIINRVGDFANPNASKRLAPK